jgi:hypothetical protein
MRGMLRANSIESTFVLSARKVACRICAQYVQFMLFGNVIPRVVPDEQLHLVLPCAHSIGAHSP